MFHNFPNAYFKECDQELSHNVYKHFPGPSIYPTSETSLEHLLEDNILIYPYTQQHYTCISIC